jgi:hypothetical protein
MLAKTIESKEEVKKAMIFFASPIFRKANEQRREIEFMASKDRLRKLWAAIGLGEGVEVDGGNEGADGVG